MKKILDITRRDFISLTALGLVTNKSLSSIDDFQNKTLSNLSMEHNSEHNPHPFFKISLAQWSLHRSFENGDLDVRNFAAIAREKFDIEAIEYVNGFYSGKAENYAFMNDIKQRAVDHDVRSLLIMVDDEGELGALKSQQNRKAVDNHKKWVDAAKVLDCHSIRINAFGEGPKEDVQQAMIDGLGLLCEYAKPIGINVLIENHGLYSSDAQWVNEIIRQINMDNCGTLPDFGNFCLTQKWGSTQDDSCVKMYDRYKGVEELMTYAKGVSAKSYAFDKSGNETKIDYSRMLEIVKSAGYSGYVGIEYEGSELSEVDGIIATKKLLEILGTP